MPNQVTWFHPHKMQDSLTQLNIHLTGYGPKFHKPRTNLNIVNRLAHEAVDNNVMSDRNTTSPNNNGIVT